MKKIVALFVLAALSFAGVTSVVFAKEQDKGPLTKITFIHYKKDRNDAKPGTTPKPRASSCYGFLGNGAKWKTPENFLVNPTGSGVNQNTVFQAVNAGVSEWEKYGGSAIFGSGSLDDTVTYDGNLLDERNSVSFGPYPDPGVIAVTTVWGYFNAPPEIRDLVEWDMLMNTNFTWGDAKTNPSVMDIQNIATHELGHSAGMADLYTSGCTAETMFGYSGNGETSKRDLNRGDIKGISSLYL